MCTEHVSAIMPDHRWYHTSTDTAVKQMQNASAAHLSSFAQVGEGLGFRV